MWVASSLFTIALFAVAIIVISRAIRVVPQHTRWDRAARTLLRGAAAGPRS
jgi:hypothetical protein